MTNLAVALPGLMTLLLSLVSPAAAQVSGRVVDAQGRPLPAVSIELVVGGRVAGTQLSDFDGRFRFDPQPVAGEVELVASMIGYPPAHRRVRAPAEGLTLTMASAAIPLEGLTVVAEPKVACPHREDPRARELWESLRSRYDHAEDTLGISFYARRYDATGPADVLNDIEESQEVHSWYGVEGRVRRKSPFYTSPYTYGYPIRTSFDPAYAEWMYRPLGTTDADHFIAASFGQRHSFHVLGQHDGLTFIRFCPAAVSQKGPSVEGILTIGRDTSLVKAEWTFHSHKPAEMAGGEVVFVERGEALMPLLPWHYLYWRKLVGHKDLYFRRSEQFVTYRFLPPDSFPTRPGPWLSVQQGLTRTGRAQR